MTVTTELKRLSREILYRGKIIDLIVDRVEYPGGNTGIREIAHHPGGAVAVPLFDDGRVMLIKQLRYPFGKHIVELPAGKLQPGEDPAGAAARELAEETGWQAGKLEKVTALYSTPGFCDEVLHLYLATGLTPSPHGPRREEGEFTMTVFTLPLEEAIAMAERGEIEDAKTVAGLLLVERRLRMR
jgi:ADP-ribose pyrophosphatase